jgi:thioredoxin-like negative regulator of GroEL
MNTASDFSRKLEDAHPVLVTAQSAVLLIFFMPSELANRQQRASLNALADYLQEYFGKQLRVLRIDEVNHPDIAQSFSITQTPAFVLVRRGIELWRQEGMSDKTTLVGLIQHLLTA